MKKISIVSLSKKTILMVFVIFMLVLVPSKIYANQLFYNQSVKEQITKGVTLETSTRITQNGATKIYVLRVSLKDDYIKLRPINSLFDNGTKETVLSMIQRTDAVAGMNADFFNMNSTYAAPFGLSIQNGIIQSANEFTNHTLSQESLTKDNRATLFLDKSNNPFINYMKTDVKFINNGGENLSISSINQDYEKSIFCVNHLAMSDTKKLDELRPNLYKIVVADGIIAAISKAGETVDLPKNGFIIVLDEKTANSKLSLFQVGQKAELKTTTSIISPSEMSMAISGGGMLLRDGIVTTEGLTVSGRHPRTAVGYNKNKDEMILLAVDGRDFSVGATPEEIGELMLEYGAYNAMHFDGGGSTSVAVKKPGTDLASLINKPSDNAERKVVNALGIYNEAPVSDINRIIINAPDKAAFIHSSIRLDVYGLDEYMHLIKIPLNEITFQTDNNAGSFFDGYYYPNQKGSSVITARYKDLTAQITIKGVELMTIFPNITEFTTVLGSENQLSFSGIGVDAEKLSIEMNVVKYEISPPDLGKITNDIFVAEKIGMGYIKCTIGDTSCYIAVNSNIIEAKTNYDKFSPLVYDFIAANETQTAQAILQPSLLLSGTPIGIRLNVNGDASGHKLKASITDQKGSQYTLEFSSRINFLGLKQLDAFFPVNVAYPVSLDSIYVESNTQEEATSHTISFSNLRTLNKIDLGKITIPKSNSFMDYLYNPLLKDASGYSITVLPDVSYKIPDMPDHALFLINKAIAAEMINSQNYVYLGNEDLSTNYELAAKYNTGDYSFFNINDVSFISLNTKNGGITASNPEQWAKLKLNLTQSQKNVIIYTDISPYNFKYTEEFTLLESILEEAFHAGKNVFVVSRDSNHNTIKVSEGIRYISMASLFKSDGSYNNDFSILRFQIINNEIRYCLERVFEQL